MGKQHGNHDNYAGVLNTLNTYNSFEIVVKDRIDGDYPLYLVNWEAK